MAFNAQEYLFQQIRQNLPAGASLADSISEVLNVSVDSAYRRIRGETPIVLDEAAILCRHFGVSVDRLLESKPGTVNFQHVRINFETYQYENYLKDLIRQVRMIGSFKDREIIYLTKDVPIFHNFYFKPLIAFRYFFWMKTILRHPDFRDRRFEMTCIDPATETLSQELSIAYNEVPSVEIWNTECINSVISQIEFYKDSGYFSDVADIRIIYQALEATIYHLMSQVEHGCKFMPGENPRLKPTNFRFFFNRVVLGDNTIVTRTDSVLSCYLNYDVLNYIATRDTGFCDYCYSDLQNLMKRATLISQTGERHRNIFFGILINKISERMKNL